MPFNVYWLSPETGLKASKTGHILSGNGQYMFDCIF